MNAFTAANEKIGRYRWTICALIFMATTINYLDRAVIALLKPFIAADLGWDAVTEIQSYTNIEIAFKVSYMIGLLFAGKLVDKFGTKMGYAVATGLWSLAAVAHGFVSSTSGFIAARIGLGLTEAGNFPAAIKATAEWFPVRERALATGLFNSGANIGAILAPLSVPLIAQSLGWQWAFVITGSVGFIWLILWFMYYEVPARQQRLGAAERNYIEAGQPPESSASDIPWFRLLGLRQTWAFAVGKFLTDPIWWFYLFWLPDFLKKQYKLSSGDVALPVATVYIIATAGSIFGGWLPKFFIDQGASVFTARRRAMLIYALAVCPIVFAQWLGIIGLAAAAHQAWSANIFTSVSDMFPKNATGSVVGIGGMFGGLGGILLSAAVQKHLFVYYEQLGSIQTAYYIMFAICAGAYLLAWAIMRLLVPRYAAIKLAS